MSYVKQNANQKLDIKTVTIPPRPEKKKNTHKFELGSKTCLAITFPL